MNNAYHRYDEKRGQILPTTDNGENLFIGEYFIDTD